jgi:hypothetical protein
MPSERFNEALATLNSSVAQVVTDQLLAWKNETPNSPWPQIARNIENETALTPAKFSKLLSDFVDALDSSPAPNAWKSACRKNQFAGRKLKVPESPKTLGRMIKLEEMINRVIDLGAFPVSILETLMADADGVDPATVDPTLPDLLRAASLGRFVIWSTFEELMPARNPFESFPASADDCCTILGLSSPAVGTWILLHYHSDADLPLTGFHRPTVADSSDFPLFRPHPESAAIFGFTHPTAPNPKGFSGRPEIVHGEITGKGLIFPYRLAV